MVINMYYQTTRMEPTEPCIIFRILSLPPIVNWSSYSSMEKYSYFFSKETLDFNPRRNYVFCSCMYLLIISEDTLPAVPT